ncbi:protein midgut expression 1 [Drosophila ficusphila]|uniref:protein midgut expression 1 n=1 Tax=Drosophila ficusphila TaxID=30025 RepID=UPI0007E79C45|nr:protein midgut expression 1 [Drosophila ficusphila]
MCFAIMCLRGIGSAICCCCKLGLKILCILAFSFVGIIIIIALVVYFCFFFNKSDETTTVQDSDPTKSTTLEEDTLTTASDAKELVRTFLHRLVDRL